MKHFLKDQNCGEMRSIKTSVNLYRILEFTFRNIRQIIVIPQIIELANYQRAGRRRCWGGARSMIRGAGQLIVNMTKTGCYYYYFIWIIKSLRRISNVYEECGSIISLSLLYVIGARTQSFLFIFFLWKELILPSFLDVLSVVSCSLREWSASQQWTSSQT